jgi:dynein intermediate chain 3, axonemal
VLFIACADGQILVWDFTDSGFRPSIELKATHAKITSLEILNNPQPGAAAAAAAAAIGNAAALANMRHQLMAVGDEVGTLHIFEVPRNLVKPVHREEAIMLKFLERELHVRIIAKLLTPFFLLSVCVVLTGH